MKFSISFLIAFLITAECLAQTFSSLAIFVSEDESSKPVAGASVIIKEAGWATKTTGSDGKAFFDRSMPIGEIHYIVSKEGYQGIEGTFNITTEGKSNTLNIKLSKFRDDRLLITGEVVDEDERDLEGAIVEVKTADIVKIAKTDASGNYKIELILNRTQYDVNTLKFEVKCSNGSGKKTETVDLTRRNVLYKDFKIACASENQISQNFVKKSLSGDWIMKFTADYALNSDGSKSPPPSSSEKEIALNIIENKGTVTGEFKWATINICSKADIEGYVKDGNLNIIITYKGTCCRGSKVSLVGRISEDFQKIEGSFEPISVPTNGCWLAWANFTMRKKE